ncbi:MAG: permease [Acutalibacteraceae bacterium]
MAWLSRLISAGLPLGVTFSFLISSPMVDLGSLVLLMSIFGWRVAAVYVLLGLLIAVAGGTLIEKLRLENQVEEFIRNGRSLDAPQEELHFKERIKYAWEQVAFTAKKVFPYVLIGVGIGAVIHNWIPETFVIKLLGIFIAICTFGIIAVGYFFNAIQVFII